MVDSATTFTVVIGNSIVVECCVFNKQPTTICSGIISGHQQIEAGAHNHIHSTTVKVRTASFSIIVEYKTILNNRVATVTINTTASVTSGIIHVSFYHTVTQGDTTEHAHTSTTVTIGVIIDNVSVLNGKTIPHSSFVFYIVGIGFSIFRTGKTVSVGCVCAIITFGKFTTLSGSISR